MKFHVPFRSILTLVAALALAVTAQAHDVTKMQLFYDKDVSLGAALAQNKAVPQAQGDEEWDGVALIPDPLEKTGEYDLHEFDILANFDNDSVRIAITWDAGPAVAYDLDLYVDRLVDGVWQTIGASTNAQPSSAAIESVTLAAPAPGKYRARVHNWASTGVMYHGAISYLSDGVITKQKKTKVEFGRATADRPDMTNLPQVQTIYFVPSDGTDRAYDTDGTLNAALAAMNQWIARETGGRTVRLDTFEYRKVVYPDITFVRGLKTAAEYADPNGPGAFSAVTTELSERGWNAYGGVKRYLIYYEGPAEASGICGTAFYTLGSGYAQYSVVFLGAAAGCGARDFGSPETGAGTSEAIAVQEMFHNEGQIRPEAIHHCAANQGHVCTAQAGSQLTRVSRGADPESIDVMFPYVTFALRDKKIDPGRDDYYEHPFLTHRDLADSPFFQQP
jgi:hypothetical protein